ncbi:hypothetical protein ACFYOF_16635 [Streptomyces sp. NPDC007148]|uniref:hypothetical protein n=1 Tax=Streptomyces sp. NPDC007148 TaxID=3364775 RepID=UPI0036CAA510
MTRPLRVLRQIVAPNGKHRQRRVRLLLDEPVTQPVAVRQVLDEQVLEELLAAGELVANESAPCGGRCRRTTFHAMHRDGSRTCWTCGTETPAGGQ